MFEATGVTTGDYLQGRCVVFRRFVADDQQRRDEVEDPRTVR